MTNPRRTLLLAAFVCCLVIVSIGAGFTVLFGDIPTWFAVLLVIGLITLAVWLTKPGTRAVPLWMLIGAGALTLLSAKALEWDERLSVLTLLVGIAAVAFVRRMPAISEPTPQFEGGTSVSAVDHSVAETSQGDAPATAGLSPVLPQPDPSRRSGGLPTVIDLVPTRMRWLAFGAGAFTTALGVMCLWALFFDDQEVETAGKVVGTFVGLMFLAFGIFFLISGLTVARSQHLTVDVQGIRRTGTGPQWDLDWSQVSALGLRVRERTRDPMTSGTGINRRRTITLMLTVDDPPTSQSRMHNTGFPPFTHHHAIPDLHPTETFSPTVMELDQAFRRLVPDLYLGVLQD